MISSKLCTASDFENSWFNQKVKDLNQIFAYHRKLWEWVMITKKLDELGLLKSGKRGLGFAVGTEPLASYFVSRGVEVIVSDLNPEDPRSKKWNIGDQLSYGLESSYHPEIVDKKLFMKNASYRSIDMNDIPKDIIAPDFTWSSCSLEHTGSIKNGLKFLKEQLRILKPGGWAVHTTELNLSSNTDTVEEDENCVIFRRKDIEEFVNEIKKEGHIFIDIDWCYGDNPKDLIIDKPPYNGNVHLKLELMGYISTSILMIFQKKKNKLIFF